VYVGAVDAVNIHMFFMLQRVAKLTSAADASGFSVLGRPRFLRSSSLFSDKESAARFRLRVALVGVGLRSMMCEEA
jgi:hypothetical protein